MSGTTAKGYPYPSGGDLISAGDDVLHSLADAIDTKLGAYASGSVLVTGFATTNPKSVAITYPVGRFIASRDVIAQATPASTNAQTCRVMVQGRGNTGMTLWAWRESGTSDLTVHWMALQQA